MNMVRWGIIGTGNIATTFAQTLQHVEDATLVAVSSRNLEKAENFANINKATKAYGSYEELALDPDIDVVYIGTPHPEHKKNAALCLKNGKAVLCEKPFTLNGKDSAYLIDLAKEHQVFLMEAMWTKLLPITQKVKEWIKEGRIGKLAYVDAKFGFYSEFDPKHRLFNPQLGGGALLDLGVYPISYMMNLMDGAVPEKITSSVIKCHNGVDLHNTVVFQYQEGVVGTLTSSMAANLGSDVIIYGDKGKIIVPQFYAAQSAELYDGNNQCTEKASLPFSFHGFEYEIKEVNRCIKAGKLESDLIPLESTLQIMKIMDGLRHEWGISYPQED